MKKSILFLVLIMCFQLGADARDYAKLQLKEAKQADKYNAHDKYFNNYYEQEKTTPVLNLKDPKLIKLDGYKDISSADYNKKVAKDNLKYKEISAFLATNKVDNYNAQAYSKDFYKIYRIAERIIRSNNLDYINWRMRILTDESFNAYSAEMSNITLNAGLIDSLAGNDDALALIIGHELSHSLLGHGPRLNKILAKIDNLYKTATTDADDVALSIWIRKYKIESKNAEYAADVEGAKLLARAGYDLEKAREALSLMNSFDATIDRFSDHPSAEKRLKNFDQNKKLFFEEEWVKQGRYNIYNSEVMGCDKSSDRKAIVLISDKKASTKKYYRHESPKELYTRYAYKSYLNGEFSDANEYFEKLLEIEKNPITYLYLSYTNEALYKKTGKKKYLAKAKEYAVVAQELAPSNDYVKEQIEAL